jgi:hypothetical protein
METNRLEAFSDAVLAIIITIAGCIYIGVALIWLVPDRRVEKVLHSSTPG